jgi:DNA-binding MarR family transcriptional regulator
LNTRELSKLSRLALTTALRWLDYLEEQGLIERKSNPFDQRMVYVELSVKGRSAIDGYLLQMRGAEMFGTGDSGEH